MEKRKYFKMQNRVYIDGKPVETLETVHQIWIDLARYTWGPGAKKDSSARRLFKFLNLNSEGAEKISDIRPIEERDHLERKYSQNVIRIAKINGESLEDPLRFWYIGKEDGLYIFTRHTERGVIRFPGCYCGEV